jgi:hypothetical protein
MLGGCGHDRRTSQRHIHQESGNLANILAVRVLEKANVTLRHGTWSHVKARFLVRGENVESITVAHEYVGEEIARRNGVVEGYELRAVAGLHDPGGVEFLDG